MARPSDVLIDLGGALTLVPVIEPVCALYDVVFSRPPFHWRADESQLHRDRLHRLLNDPTFGAALSWQDDRLIGFAYGFALPADTQRWASLTEPIADDVAAEWAGRTFVLFDLAVEPAARGQGVGRLLHDGLLGSRYEERATLTVQPTATDTKAIYTRWGWHMVGQIDGGPTGAAPVFDVYLLPSLAELHAVQSTP